MLSTKVNKANVGGVGAGLGGAIAVFVDYKLGWYLPIEQLAAFTAICSFAVAWIGTYLPVNKS